MSPTWKSSQTAPPEPDAVEDLLAPPPPVDGATDDPHLPLDAEAEREAYAALVAMINAHKDGGTTVTLLDPDAFASGLN